MFNSFWTYPWDLLDLGIKNSLEELKSAGIDGISLATSYHAGRFLQARSPKRKAYFPEDGTVYFNLDKNKYKDLLIQPRESNFIKENRGFLDKLFSEAEKLNMEVSGWTVALHNTRVGKNYPEVTVKNAFGDPYYYNLCPSNEDVREYIKVLIEDITSKHPYYALELESLNYMGFFHEYHHEKDGVGLTAKDDFLLSLCFCDACKERAKKEGINIEPAQKRVKSWIEEFCSNEIPENDDKEFMEQGLEYFKDFPEVYKYLQWRSTVVTSLAEEIYQGNTGNSKIYFLSLLTPDKSWLFGIDFKEISKVNDGIVVCCYETAPEQVGLDIEQSVAEVDSSTPIMTGLRVFCPEVHSKEELKEKVRKATESGTGGFVFYNYGLIPQKRINWVKDALSALE